MKLSEYKIGDVCEVLIDNIETGETEWRKAQVVDSRIIEPGYGERHKPYTMLMVNVIRTYFQSKPVMVFDEDLGVDVYGGDEGIYYDKENTEGFIYEVQVKPIV